MAKLNIIILPIYKSLPSWNEMISFNQCLNVLSKHPMCIITYKELDISYYTNLLKEEKIVYKIEYFNKNYFENIAGYNKLMLSSKLYKRFEDFKYILIYQLDAWVFRDELDHWCQKEFDYIGAPWFENYSLEGTKIQEFAGNGGFSLRKVKSIIEIFNSHRLYKSPKELFLHDFKNHTFLIFCLRIPLNLVKSLGYRNTFKYFHTNIYSSNEDILLANIIPKYFPDFKVAHHYEAVPFAFECQPEKLYELNKGNLPFGCHGWHIYNFEFWKRFIVK